MERGSFVKSSVNIDINVDPIDPEEQKIHEKYMKEAIKQAKKAAVNGDVPIGCVIVYSHNFPAANAEPGQIIARSYNKRNRMKTSLGHAEILAIRKACKVLDDWRLEDCTMYVTLEPCQMCAGAIIQSRLSRVVIGAMNPKAGCAGSIIDLLHVKDFNHEPEVIKGVMADRCSGLLKEFFRSLRSK
ncbi:MAG: nucleoside deaminase [Lachnospiraceae bacterium]|jgi:tRNA(adenine34) deaminase|nr:nucleoside deaminase [Lachnospiraceae bacterium]MEE3460353.1 nucleoside deaminase [Lachnospiraceae bacterium]